MRFEPATNCFKCMFCPMSCCGLCKMTGDFSFEGDDKMWVKNWTFCMCLKPSPIPCCMGCGCGPCAQEPLHVRQPDGTWKGQGGPFPGDPGCCAGCCTQEHNIWSFPKDPNSKENASTYRMSQNNETNCAIPPCASESPCNCCPCCPAVDVHMIGWIEN